MVLIDFHVQQWNASGFLLLRVPYVNLDPAFLLRRTTHEEPRRFVLNFDSFLEKMFYGL